MSLPNGPIAPSRTVSSSTSVMATCGPCRVPAGVVQNVPASQRLPPVSTRAGEHEHVLVGRVGVDRDGRARGEPRAVDRPVGHGLGEWHQCDAWQEVDSEPCAGAGIGEGLVGGHCGVPMRVGNLGFSLESKSRLPYDARLKR